MMFILAMAWLTSGCGSGGAGYGGRTFSGLGAAPTPGSLQFRVQYASTTSGASALARDAVVVSGVPDTVRTVMVHVVNPITGQDVVPPVMAPHTPGTGDQAVNVPNVPVGAWQ